MARMSRADQVIIEQTEDLIRRIQARAGFTKSIQEVLSSDPLLLGEATFAVRLFVELDHIKIDDPVLIAFLDAQ